MLDRIAEAKRFAVPPISNFYVGAVARGLSGRLYLGANFEFPGQALSFCVHAEQAAVVQAMAGGETGLEMIAVSAAPCGYCRQFLYELTTASTLQIVIPNRPPTLLSSLLPAAFGPPDLGVDAALMSPQAHGLTLDAPDALAAAALAAANASYAPYSQSYAGVALQTRDGAMYSGSVAENAAYNPSLSPMEAAIVNLVMGGGKSYADVADAVLVEVKDAKASQADAARAVLAAIGDVPLRLYTSVHP
ncbi:MAG TPA: cytidine deaminase [Thermoanaerobaculia bacterium]|nr:cytidine deaminase [Thermoanaerobaculia bacterium]